MLEQLGRIGLQTGTRTFLVGGPVRDLLLGHESPDLDIAVESGCREFGTAVAKELGGRFVYHSRFLTGTVLTEKPSVPDSGSETPTPGHVDVTRTRAEAYARPAALPVVEPAGIEDDLIRRDFAINAMALEITPGAFGRLIDPHSGRADLAKRRVRILHERSFIDDPTRIFRCIRFATRLHFDVEPATLELLRAAVGLGLPALLSPERILYELRLVCAEPLVLQMVEAIVVEKVLQSTWNWNAPRHLLSGLARLAQSRAEPELLFVYLLSTLPMTDRFPVKKEERNAAAALGRPAAIRAGLSRARRPSAVYRLLHRVPRPALRILSLLEPAPAGLRIRAFFDEMAQVTTALSGRDLRQLGLKPGPAYRAILDKLLFARLDGKIRSVTDELALCRRLMRNLRQH